MLRQKAGGQLAGGRPDWGWGRMEAGARWARVFGFDPVGGSISPGAASCLVLGRMWAAVGGGEGQQACVLVPLAAPAPHLVWVPTSLPVCPQALRVNGLEQLCNNLGSERLQLWHRRLLLAQEEVREPGWEEAGMPSCLLEQRLALGESGHSLRALPQSPLAVGCLGPSEPQFTHLYNGKVSPALAQMRPPMGTGGLHEPSAGCSQEECRRESLPWVPIPQAPQESCLDLLVDQPHSLLSILDAQTWLSQVSPSCWGTRSGGCLVARPEPAGPSRGEIKSEVLGPCSQALSTAWEGGGHTGFRSLVSG